MADRHPAAIVMEIDFAGPDMGLPLADEAQAGLEQKLPVLFFSQSETDTPTRLAAARAGGQDFFTGTLDASGLLEKIETLSRVSALRALPRADRRRLPRPGAAHRDGPQQRRHRHPRPHRAAVGDGRAGRLPAGPDHPRHVHARVPGHRAGQGDPPARAPRQRADHLPVRRGRPGQAAGRHERRRRRLPHQADPAAPPDRHRAHPRRPRAQPQGADGARQPDRPVQPHPYPAAAGGRPPPRPSRRAPADLRDARHRPLQAGQRPLRPPHGRPGDQGPGAVPQAAPAQDRPHRPLRRRGIRRGPAGHRRRGGAPGARRDPPALRRDPLPGATDRPPLHLQLRHRRTRRPRTSISRPSPSRPTRRCTPPSTVAATASRSSSNTRQWQRGALPRHIPTKCWLFVITR